MNTLKKLILAIVTVVVMMGLYTGAVLAEDESESEIQLQETNDTYNILLIGVDRRDESWVGNSDVML